MLIQEANPDFIIENVDCPVMEVSKSCSFCPQSFISDKDLMLHTAAAHKDLLDLVSTALALAVQQNHYSVARLLSESGADGHRMLLELLSQQNFEMADCLMAGGPRMTRIEDPRIQSALEIVVKYLGTKK